MDIKIKIKILLKKIKINSGSIDMIVTPANEFYFLEINPTGQFNFLSEYTNSYVEKLIAYKLIKHEKS
jgi:D-alanine-D-alanine ligase-like ATP-grasp enzyme